MEKDTVLPCWVCGKVWKRKDADSWHYFNGMLVCSGHNGAKEWYEGALNLSESRFNIETDMCNKK